MKAVVPAGPNVLFGNFGATKSYTYYDLKERGVTRAVTIEADSTNANAPYLFINQPGVFLS